MSESLHWSRGILQRVSTCPGCGWQGETLVRYQRRDNEDAMPDCWTFAQCTACGSIWLDPRPDAVSLHRAYDSYYTHEEEVESKSSGFLAGIAWRCINGYLNKRFGMQRNPSIALGYPILSLMEAWRLKLDYYGRHLVATGFPRGRLIDIGCGSGSFLSRAREMGWDVAGCEPDPKAVSICERAGLDVIEGDAFDKRLTPRTFDVVTMSHVLEHVGDPQRLLSRAFELLRPGGTLWLALPNPASCGRGTFGSAWHALHPPYHLCIPSQAVLSGWLAAAGFSNVRFRRRGAHARRVWEVSRRIGVRNGISVLPTALLSARRVMADTLATISPRWGEETVVMAQRPSGFSGD